MREFEWDPGKRLLNLRKHSIAFEDAVAIFQRPYLESPDGRRLSDELRLIAYGEAGDLVIAVVYTWRG